MLRDVGAGGGLADRELLDLTGEDGELPLDLGEPLLCRVVVASGPAVAKLLDTSIFIASC